MQFDRSARQAAVVCKLLTFNSRISNNAFFTTAVPKQCPRHSFAGHVSSSRRRRQVPLRPGAAPPFSDSESDDTASQPSTSTRRLPVDFEALAAAERSIAGQQAAGLPPSYSLEQTRVSPQRKLASEIDALRNFSAVPEVQNVNYGIETLKLRHCMFSNTLFMKLPALWPALAEDC